MTLPVNLRLHLYLYFEVKDKITCVTTVIVLFTAELSGWMRFLLWVDCVLSLLKELTVTEW